MVEAGRYSDTEGGDELQSGSFVAAQGGRQPSPEWYGQTVALRRSVSLRRNPFLCFPVPNNMLIWV